MSNSESYKAILKVQRWRDTPILSAADASALSGDMEVVYQALINQSETIRKLKLSEFANNSGQAPPIRVRRERLSVTVEPDPLACMGSPVKRSLVSKISMGEF